MLALDLKERFLEMANLLELAEENVFKIRAYRTGAEIVGGMSEEILSEYTAKQLQDLPGIGMALAEKIIEYRDSGKIQALQQLKKGFPVGLLTLLDIPGLGPKTLKILWMEFQVKNIADLKRLLKSGELAERFGFGEKKVENLEKGIDFFEKTTERIPLQVAQQIADEILAHMRTCPAVQEIEVCGSLRRQQETVGDIDVLVSSIDAASVIAHFLKLPLIAEVNAHGETKASIFTTNHRQVDLRVVPPESYGAALQYFTGSKEHNILLRRIAQKQGLLLSEWGVFRGKEMIAGATEKEVYNVLGQSLVPPEERLGRDELKADSN